MIECGSQCLTCDYPIHFDTYKGCEHACKYCYVKHKYSIDDIEGKNTTRSLLNFINGKRNFETKWCDWDIPLHWGANSDPFQPLERKYKHSLNCLKIFAETGYPFIISTKNPGMLTEEPYLSLIQKCNVVLQVSMACSKYDKLEQGAPSYEERLKAVKFLSDKIKRIVVRVRPYFPDCHKDIMREIPRYKDAGVYAISVSAFYSLKKQKGMTRYGSTYQFPNDFLYPKYKELKEQCHKNGIVFLCSEAGLDFMGDNLNCCGCDSLDDFKPNIFNVSHIAYDEITPQATEAMKATDTYQPFKAIGQNQAWAKKCIGKSFEQLMWEIGGERIEWLREQKEIFRG
jgi:DNA repair photolyase